MSCTLYSTVCLLIDHFEGTIEMNCIKTFFDQPKCFRLQDRLSSNAKLSLLILAMENGVVGDRKLSID